MTNLDPTSLCAIFPSGETLDLVSPGMSRVVGRERGVKLPESCLRGGLEKISRCRNVQSTDMLTYWGY